MKQDECGLVMMSGASQVGQPLLMGLVGHPCRKSPPAGTGTGIAAAVTHRRFPLAPGSLMGGLLLGAFLMGLSDGRGLWAQDRGPQGNIEPKTAISASKGGSEGEKAPVGAESRPQVLTMDDAVALALEHNLGFRSSGIDLGVKERKASTAWNVFVPTIDVAGSLYRLNKEQSGTTLIPVGPLTGGYYGVIPYSYTAPQWGMAGSLSFSLNLNVALLEGIRNVQLDYQSGKLSYEKARAQLERDVRKAYLQLLLLQKNLALLQENLAAAQRRYEQARANYRAGLVPELTMLQAQVALENLKPTLTEMENGIKTYRANFAFLLGLPGDAAFSLEPVDLPAPVPLDEEAIVRQAVANKPELQELRNSILVLESTKKATWYNLYTPTLSLSWNFDPTFAGDPWKDSWFDGDKWNQRSGMFRASLAWRLNGLFPFSKEAQSLKDLEDNLSKLQVSLAQAVRGVELEVYSAVLKLKKSEQTIASLNLNATLAEKAYRLTEEAYRAGSKELLEVQNAELEMQKARLEIIKEQFNYLTACIDLEYAMGVPYGSLTRSK
ncbi:TolC family protein [Treponema sp. J25]|uniref:TolC family protein n=1 Tax=Treponema sp. J25 TaxID=2094121 RepID=UPI00140503C6|nr:TolC family protein [Treponema sp. J25]